MCLHFPLDGLSLYGFELRVTDHHVNGTFSQIFKVVFLDFFQQRSQGGGISAFLMSWQKLPMKSWKCTIKNIGSLFMIITYYGVSLISCIAEYVFAVATLTLIWIRADKNKVHFYKIKLIESLFNIKSCCTDFWEKK